MIKDGEVVYLRKQLAVEIKSFFREPIYVFFSLLLPVISFTLFASMYSGNSYGEFDYFQKYIPGFLTIILYSSGMFTVGLQIVSDKELGIYRRLRATPVKISNIIFVSMLKGYFVIFIALMEIVFISKGVYKAELTSYPIQFIITFFFATSVVLLIGFTLAILCKTMKTSLVILMVTFYPMFFLADATIPLSIMPKVFEKIAIIINPFYHVNNVIRMGWMGELTSLNSNGLLSVLYLIGCGIVCSLISTLAFNREDNL